MVFLISVFYLLLAIDKAFFPIYITGDYADTMRQMRSALTVNIVPFNFDFSDEMPGLVWQQLFENILLTEPFGSGISFVVPVKPGQVKWLVLGTGLGIEGIQLVISLLLQYSYKVIDITDMILNGFGVFIGYAIFWCLA